ncbi:MAG: hypothetical protein K1X92_07125 [Bacteroidia bacterium]|nr:hypothetical protein [Bacteroidia bacterium]
MKKNVFTGIFLLSCMLPVALLGQKQRVYTLKQGERIKTMECGMGITNAADGYTLLIEKAEMESPGQDENNRTTFYAVTPKKTYGPYIEPVVNSYSPDTRYGAVILTEGDPENYENTRSYVLFNDGRMEGPFKGYSNVVFAEDNTEWAITADFFDAKTEKSSTTLQFKGGKPIYSKKSEYVVYAPKGHYSARVTSDSDQDGNYWSEYYFSNDTKYGPCEVRQFQFTENGNGYGLLCSKAGQLFMVVNGKETRVSGEVSSFQMAPDGSEWALQISNPDGSGYIEFANGKKTELYQYIAVASLFYDKSRKCFGWVTGDMNDKIEVHFSNGNKLGPFTTPSNLPQMPPAETEEPPVFFLSAYPAFNTSGSEWCMQVISNTSNCLLYKNKQGEWSLEGAPGLINNGFDGKSNFYYIVEEGVDTENYVFNYYIVYPNLNKKEKLPEYPYGITFPEDTDKWYMQLSDGSLYFNDKTMQKDAFAMRYDKKEKKLYWMSLEGQTIFLNSKPF